MDFLARMSVYYWEAETRWDLKNTDWLKWKHWCNENIQQWIEKHTTEKDVNIIYNSLVETITNGAEEILEKKK